MCDLSEVLCSNGLRINHLALSLQKESQILLFKGGQSWWSNGLNCLGSRTGQRHC